MRKLLLASITTLVIVIGVMLLYKFQKTLTLRATTYRKTKSNPWTGSGSFVLYEKGNRKLMALSFGPDQVIQINGVYYKMTKDIND
jgi:hypothetical protein